MNDESKPDLSKILELHETAYEAIMAELEAHAAQLEVISEKLNLLSAMTEDMAEQEITIMIKKKNEELENEDDEITEEERKDNILKLIPNFKKDKNKTEDE